MDVATIDRQIADYEARIIALRLRRREAVRQALARLNHEERRK